MIRYDKTELLLACVKYLLVRHVGGKWGSSMSAPTVHDCGHRRA